MSRGDPTAPTERNRTVSKYVPSTREPAVAVSRSFKELPEGTVAVSGATPSQVAPPSSGSYGTLFFSLTGLHGIHVFIGLMISLWVQARAWQGAFDEHRHVTVQNFVMYWHFVDTVWVFVLATIYLSPHFI